MRRVTAAVAAIVLLTCPLATVSFVPTNKWAQSGSFARRAQPPAPSLLRRRRNAYSSVRLWYSRYDNLVAGIAEISMGTSIGVLWSEFAVLTTGCGPLQLSDALERFCYQAVLVAAGLALFFRIATGKDAVSLTQDVYGELQDFTLVQVRAAEWLLLLAVLGAFAALASQMMSGQQMDGMSGINVQMCRAIRDL